jgi:CRP/FNR family cyclic AMP-dependent transcriptional regulator
VARRPIDPKLCRLAVFRGCSDDEIRRVLALADRAVACAGEVVIRAGELTKDVYILVEGTARVTRDGEQIGVLEAGDYCGELAALDPAPRNATVTMVTDGTLLVLGQREFTALLEELPTLSRRMLNGLARRVHVLDPQPA